jgi:hypothetical protein
VNDPGNLVSPGRDRSAKTGASPTVLPQPLRAPAAASASHPLASLAAAVARVEPWVSAWPPDVIRPWREFPGTPGLISLLAVSPLVVGALRAGVNLAILKTLCACL